MSLSTCNHCGGHIPLGPDASNVCDDCGAHVFSQCGPKAGDRIDVDYEDYANLVNERDRFKDALEYIAACAWVNKTNETPSGLAKLALNFKPTYTDNPTH